MIATLVRMDLSPEPVATMLVHRIASTIKIAEKLKFGAKNVDACMSRDWSGKRPGTELRLGAERRRKFLVKRVVLWSLILSRWRHCNGLSTGGSL
jgi:hypothetical protein